MGSYHEAVWSRCPVPQVSSEPVEHPGEEEYAESPPQNGHPESILVCMVNSHADRYDSDENSTGSDQGQTRHRQARA